MLLSTAFETVPSWLFSVIKGVCFSLIIVTYRLVVLSLWSLTLTKKAFTSAYCDRFLSSSTVSHLFIWRHNLVTWVLCEFCWTRLVCAWIRQQLYMWDDCSSRCLQFLHFQVTFSGLDSGANPDLGEYLSGELTRATGLHWGAGGGGLQNLVALACDQVFYITTSHAWYWIRSRVYLERYLVPGGTVILCKFSSVYRIKRD